MTIFERNLSTFLRSHHHFQKISSFFGIGDGKMDTFLLWKTPPFFERLRYIFSIKESNWFSWKAGRWRRRRKKWFFYQKSFQNAWTQKYFVIEEKFHQEMSNLESKKEVSWLACTKCSGNLMGTPSFQQAYRQQEFYQKCQLVLVLILVLLSISLFFRLLF